MNYNDFAITPITIKSNRFKTNYISLNFIFPLNKEDAPYYAIMPELIRCYNKRHKGRSSVAMELDRLYGASLRTDTSKIGDFQVVTVSFEFLDEKYTLNSEKNETALCFLSELFTEFYFDNNIKILNVEKNNLADKVRALFNDKRSYALYRCAEIMCKNDPYGLCEYGSIDNILNINPDKIDEYYNRFKKGYKVIFTGGNISETDLSHFVDTTFEKSDISVYVSKVFKDNNLTEETEYANITQGKLTLGFETGVSQSNDKIFALILLNTIFGGSATSKLFENVREKLSLCYYCSSYLEKHKGIMFVNSGIEIKNKDVAQKAILKELDDIKSGNITDFEIESAKKFILNIYKSSNDSFSQLKNYYLSLALSGKKMTPEEFSDKIASVNKEDVINVAQGINLKTVYFLTEEAK